MENNFKITDYFKYCATCKHRDVAEDEEPCDECLMIGARPDSHKPEHYEERE